MRRVLLVCMLAIGGVGGVFAQAKDPLAVYYHNTLNIYMTLGVSHYYINADHTWSADTFDRRRPAGTWNIKGDQVCFHAPRHPDECLHLMGKTVGQPWVMTEEKAEDPDGYEDYVAIVHPGRDYDMTMHHQK